ncbi:MAG TPA: cation transporter [Bryobacteraceae bacterium]|nr:cation transporter [Bryobacteraceae bacterium]
MLAATLWGAPPPGSPLPNQETVTRAVATLNGVFSPRGFFNITVRLYTLDGIRAAKFDLKKSQMTVDFEPSASVDRHAIEQVLRDAGYRPGAVRIESLPHSRAAESGPGWMQARSPRSKNPVTRWFFQNF